MSDYSRTKKIQHTNYPNKGVRGGVAGFSRVEAMLTVDRLKQEFLFGVPLVSYLTKERMTDETLKNMLNRAAARVELECKIDISPVQRETHLPFDRTKYLQGWNQLDLASVPLLSIEELSIRGSDSVSSPDNTQGGGPDGKGSMLYNVPLEWIDLSQANKGLIHMVPLISSFTGTGMVGAAIQGPAAALFMVFNQLPNIPSYWYIRYTSGFEENCVPASINELLGCYAALEILSLIGPLRFFNSQSISIDGTGQSVAGPGPALFAQRIQELNQRIMELKDLIKARFSQKLVMSHI